VQRIEPIERRDGVEAVRLTLLSPAERELERERRERRRREQSGSAAKPASERDATGHPAGDAAPPRLDLRA
jgi:hypothetical protein